MLPSSPPVVPPAPPAPQPRLSYFRYASLDHFASGVSAGLIATVTLHPFDLIKTRLQVAGFEPAAGAKTGAAATATGHVPTESRRSYRGSVHAARSLIRYEGWSSLYKGLSPNLVGNTVAWGLYFFAYDLAKRSLSTREPFTLVRLLSNPAELPTTNDQPGSNTTARRPLNALEHILAASATGVFVSALTNPLWVVKTRMFLDHSRASDSASRPRVSLVGALVSLYRSEGVGGLYRGFVPGLFGVSHGAVQFMVYEELKKWRLAQRSRRASTSSLETQVAAWSAPETIAMSVASKAFAACATYPYQVIRSRAQASDTPVSLRSVVRATWRAEGLAGFYRGLWVNLVKVMPAACTVFVVYEQMGGYMKRHATFEQRA